jgi:adenylate cyclase
MRTEPALEDAMGSASDFFAELQRRKVVRAVLAYGVAAWLVVQIGDAVFEPLHLPEWSMSLLVAFVALGFPLVLALAWAFEFTSTGLRREAPAIRPDAATKDSPATAPAQPSPPPASVAVLPFVDLSEHHDQAYFCDGVAEEILDRLVHIDGLNVAARVASFQFRDYAGDVAEIARRLNVAAVLEGSVRKSGDHLRVTAQLVAARDGYHLWSDHYDGATADVFAVQDEIAESIASALQVSLHPQDRQRMQCGRTGSLEAYECYLRGLSYFHAFSWRTMEYARQMFLQALEIDPGYGRAWAGLAYAAGYIYLYRQADEKYRQEALEASARALACCDTAEARTARGVALSLMQDYEQSDVEFRKALDLDPDHYEALWLYGRLEHQRGEFAHAAELWQRAATVNADDYQAALLLPQAFLAMQRPDEARAWQEKGLKRALRHLERHPDDVRALYLAAVTHAELGHVEEARKAAEQTLRLEPEDGIARYNLACAYTALGELDKAIDMLETSAYKDGKINREWLEHDATLARLHDSPRFQALVERLQQ